MFLVLMSCGPCNVSFDDVSRGVFLLKHTCHAVWFHNILLKKEQGGNSSFFFSLHTASRYQHLWCVNSCARSVFPLKCLMLVGGTGMSTL